MLHTPTAITAHQTKAVHGALAALFIHAFQQRNLYSTPVLDLPLPISSGGIVCRIV